MIPCNKANLILSIWCYYQLLQLFHSEFMGKNAENEYASYSSIFPFDFLARIIVGGRST